MNNENSFNSGKIDSNNPYGSQESKLSRNSGKDPKKETKSNKGPLFDSTYVSRKEQRGPHSYSLDMRGVEIISDRTNNIINGDNPNFYTKNYADMARAAQLNKQRNENLFDSNSFSEIENRIQRAPKNFVPHQQIPKQSIRSVKGNLYEALNNINKELNVKIEKKEIPKIRMSLLDYPYQNSMDQPDPKTKLAKKIDIEDVMGNLSNIIKDNYIADLNLNPLNLSKKEFAEAGDAAEDYLNIEGLLDNSNLNLSGIRFANEVDKNKFINQMHSNYSSIYPNPNPKNINTYNRKRRNLSSQTIQVEPIKGNVKEKQYNSQGEGKIQIGIEELITNKNFDSVKNENVYLRTKLSPNKKNKADHENAFIESTHNSNYESQSQSQSQSHLIKESLIHFNDKNINDLKEKEIFENLIKNEILLKKFNNHHPTKLNGNTVSDDLYTFDFKQFLKLMKTRELEFTNKELELSSLKNEIAFLKKDAEHKDNSKKTSELKQETDSELKQKIKELELQLNSANLHNSKLEKENGILKNELVNQKKNKNFLLKRFNEEIVDMTKLTKDFLDNFVSIEN
jgi:hypothetical protein